MVKQVGGPQTHHAQQNNRPSSNPKPEPSGGDNQATRNSGSKPSGGESRASQGRAPENRGSERQLSAPQGALDPRANFEVSQNLKNKQTDPSGKGQEASRKRSGGEQFSTENTGKTQFSGKSAYGERDSGSNDPQGNTRPTSDTETPATAKAQSPATPEPNQQPAPTIPDPQGDTKPQGSDNPKSPVGGQTGAINGGGPNELILKNTDNEAATIGLFENFAPGMNPNITGPAATFTVQAGDSLTLSMPESWQGRAQKLGGAADDPATWAELNYENKNGEHKLWYDNSLIRGYNSAVTIKPTHSNNPADVAGSGQSLLAGAPQDIITTDSGGNPVIKDVEPYTGGVNSNVENYLDSAEGNNNSYIRFDDHNAVRTSTDNSLTVTFGAA